MFDWNASMNQMLGLAGTPSAGTRTGLVVAYEHAMTVPVSQLDEIQLGRFWGQSPSEAMLEVLIPTTIRHLEADIFSAYGSPTFVALARVIQTRPQHEPAFAALLETWAQRIVEILHAPNDFLEAEREVAVAAYSAAERYPTALFAFETEMRAKGDQAMLRDLLFRRSEHAATPAERIALLCERARLCEQHMDLFAAQSAWLDVLRVDAKHAGYDELLRLCALDPDPPWTSILVTLRTIARDANDVDLLRRLADLAATKLDDPTLVQELLDELATLERRR